MKIVIIGAGAASLFAALLLARARHEITVLEQDQLEPTADMEGRRHGTFRPTAPQIVQPHIVMARGRELLVERLPDVSQGLLAAGVAEAPLATQMPPTLTDRSAWPGDERLTALMTHAGGSPSAPKRTADRSAHPRATAHRARAVAGTAANRHCPPHTVVA